MVHKGFIFLETHLVSVRTDQVQRTRAASTVRFRIYTTKDKSSDGFLLLSRQYKAGGVS